MTMSMEEQQKGFMAYIQKREHYREALNLMEWDLRTGSPKKAASLRAEVIGTLSDKVFRMKTSPELGAYLDELSNPDVFSTRSPIVQRLISEERKQFNRNRKVPQERNRAYEILRAESEAVWEEAKETSSFTLFQPFLEQMVAMKREFVGYWGYDEHPYDAMMDTYEPGLTVKKLDPVFAYLRDETVKLLQAIVGSSHRPDGSVLDGTFPKHQQVELSLFLLTQMGFDFGAGRLDETVHPFEEAVNRYDVRVTTNYRETDFTFALFSTIHEGGHALYEQGINPDLIGTPLCNGASLGIHESQSRFWENMIGLSREFWQANYGKLQAAFPQFDRVPLDDFYGAVNEVNPSLIRIEADELTYNLHIMVRYELEKELITNAIEVKDLPELWRQKMKDYLGVVPDSDATGVLQDVHWSGGDFGYFPTYSLGNIYAAQFRHQLSQEMPDYLGQVKQGNLLGIKEWLNHQIHQYGKLLDPVDIVRQVTGEEPNPTYLVEYLKTKFGALYHL